MKRILARVTVVAMTSGFIVAAAAFAARAADQWT